MGLAVDQTRIDRCLDAVFDATLVPGHWPIALAELANLFNAGFADICSWTPDRASVVGIAHGLDHRDYDDQLLGFWFNRNVWTKKSPVRIPGEVISTRQMMSREDLRRSQMFREYLDPRGLHEGLRLSLWVETDSLSDISLLRPWSQGAFGPVDVDLGFALLPHLQRAALLARRLSQARAQLDLGADEGQDHGVAVIAFDHGGTPTSFNAAAEAVLRQGSGLRLVGRELEAATPEATRQLAEALAKATGQRGGLRMASAVRLPWGRRSETATVVVQPLSRQGRWPVPRPPAALAIFRDPGRSLLSVVSLRRMFGLTEAEAQVALDLLAGHTVGVTADSTGRSRNTVRAHLARAMEKTGTTRQVDLVRLLTDLDRLGPPAKPFL